MKYSRTEYHLLTRLVAKFHSLKLRCFAVNLSIKIVAGSPPSRQKSNWYHSTPVSIRGRSFTHPSRRTRPRVRYESMKDSTRRVGKSASCLKFVPACGDRVPSIMLLRASSTQRPSGERSGKKKGGTRKIDRKTRMLLSSVVSRASVTCYSRCALLDSRGKYKYFPVWVVARYKNILRRRRDALAYKHYAYRNSGASAVESIREPTFPA